MIRAKTTTAAVYLEGLRTWEGRIKLRRTGKAAGMRGPQIHPRDLRIRLRSLCTHRLRHNLNLRHCQRLCVPSRFGPLRSVKNPAMKSLSMKKRQRRVRNLRPVSGILTRSPSGITGPSLQEMMTSRNALTRMRGAGVAESLAARAKNGTCSTLNGRNSTEYIE